MNPLNLPSGLKVYLFLLLFSLSTGTAVHAQVKEKSSIKGYGQASYAPSTYGAYMKNWLLLGPVPVSEGEKSPAAQEKAFDSDLITRINISSKKALPSVEYKGQAIGWQEHKAAEDIIDLDKIYHQQDFAASYALAEIKADSSYTTFLAVGSDDGIKIWHNGKLIHRNWIGRGVIKDEDLIPIKLVKGSNQLLLKVQDMNMGWGFSARVLDKASSSDEFISAAGKGSLEQLHLFLAHGVDINTTNAAGLSALHLAQIRGREAVVALLKEKGAIESPMPSEEAIIDHFYQELNEKEAPGVAVLIAKEGETLYRKGFGYSDIKNKTRVSPATIFRIGSVTKQFTAAAMLKLQEEGFLRVEDKLSKFLPDFPRADEVSIHHLLTHTSGIHSYTSKQDFIEKVEGPVTAEELINYFKNDPYDFNPGEEFRYNNSGYFLLGHIISLVTGQSYGDYLKSTFFDPLEMQHTGVHQPGLHLQNEALGYGFAENTYDASINWDMSWAGGAGALYSTVDDLLKWNNALAGGRLLNESSLQAAYTPVKLNNGQSAPNGDYGYGFVIGNFRGKKVINHGGGLHGFLSHLAYFPESKLSVVMFTNVAPPQAEFDFTKLAEVYLWKELEKQKSYETVAYAAEDLKKYEGRFDFGNGAILTITTENDRIIAQLSGQQRFEIFPSSEDEFFWKVVEARIQFNKDEEGNVNDAMFSQGGQNIRITRMEEIETIQLDPSLYDGYVGKYDYGNEFYISVFTENDRIFAQGTNQPRFEIFPVSQTEFILKDLNARITFVKNDTGGTEKLILNMQGQNKDAPKIE